MDTLGLCTQYKVRHCSQCQGDTEFYCHTCNHDMCLLCKERHVIDLDTKHHDVVIYREKFKCFPLREICVRHPTRRYIMFCDQCKYPVCKHCTEHRTHALMDLRTTYQTKREQHRDVIENIKSETLYNCLVLLTGIQTDIQTCSSQICHRQSQMSTKAQRLKDLVDTVVSDVQRYRGLLIARIQQQKRKIYRQLVKIQTYEGKYEQLANRAVQYLVFIKTSRGPQKNSPSQLLSFITEIQLTTGKRQVGIDECVKASFTPVLHTSLCVTGVGRVLHISGVTSEQFWLSDLHSITLTDTTGGTIYRVTDLLPVFVGIHTVNISGELIFIDSRYNINKLSIDNKTVTTLLENPTSPWRPRCVYCSLSTGDLMVGMWNPDTKTGKITRYNSTGHQHILTIQHDNKGNTLYHRPIYITENKNGDIIVSDWRGGAVVVTERSGRHRFSYTGPPPGSSLSPRGICTDALSHILVCDDNIRTVQIIDKDGHFLSLLLTQQHGISDPQSLNYDFKTHLLWVGSWDKSSIVSLYRYIHRRYSLMGKYK